MDSILDDPFSGLLDTEILILRLYVTFLSPLYCLSWEACRHAVISSVPKGPPSYVFGHPCEWLHYTMLTPTLPVHVLYLFLKSWSPSYQEVSPKVADPTVLLAYGSDSSVVLGLWLLLCAALPGTFAGSKPQCLVSLLSPPMRRQNLASWSLIWSINAWAPAFWMKYWGSHLMMVADCGRDSVIGWEQQATVRWWFLCVCVCVCSGLQGSLYSFRTSLL
jgi:hypothetical protein